ncbi:unnamed protein product [Penicillium salamii]|nr:unnamed protein product [Penicillium salamii]
MDAQAYLIKHGWSGPGNPLKTERPGQYGGLGLTRPILVARKSNNHGVGKKTTKDATNQWWLRGFEDALKGVGQDSHEANSAREGNALTSELYRHFVRGTELAGTLEPMKTEEVVVSAEEAARIKKEEEREEKKARKEGRAARRAQKAVKKELKAGRKEARRVKRVAKVERREKKVAERAARKVKKVETEGEDYPTPMSIDQEVEAKIDLDEAASRLREKKAKKEKVKSTEGEGSKKKSKKVKA